MKDETLVRLHKIERFGDSSEQELAGIAIEEYQKRMLLETKLHDTTQEIQRLTWNLEDEEEERKRLRDMIKGMTKGMLP